MHWLEDAPSFDLFSSITNLNENQKLYARTLKPGFAIVRSKYGQPVHIKVPEFGDQENIDSTYLEDVSDHMIKAMMIQRNNEVGIDFDETVDSTDLFWKQSLFLSHSIHRTSKNGFCLPQCPPVFIVLAEKQGAVFISPW